MKELEIKFVKTHVNAILPSCNHSGEGIGDTGYDLVCVEDTTIPFNGSAVVPIGIKVGYITPGYWFKIEARSGLGFKHSLQPHLGIIDNGYRGDCGVKVYNFGPNAYKFKAGDKVAQLVVYKLLQPKVSWTEEVIETERGEKGFGSSDYVADIRKINANLKNFLISPKTINEKGEEVHLVSKKEFEHYITTPLELKAKDLESLFEKCPISVEVFEKILENSINELKNYE